MTKDDDNGVPITITGMVLRTAKLVEVNSSLYPLWDAKYENSWVMTIIWRRCGSDNSLSLALQSLAKGLQTAERLCLQMSLGTRPG